MNERIFTKEKLFWRDGECFIGFFNEDETEIQNLRVLRLDVNGELMSVDAGFGLVAKGAIWNAKDLSVIARSSGASNSEPLINKPPLGSKKNLIPFRKIQEAAQAAAGTK